LTLTITVQKGGTEKAAQTRLLRGFLQKGASPLYQRSEMGFGQAGTTASLSLDQLIRAPRIPLSATGFGARALHWFETTDFVTDLGTNLFSLEWFRGAATCAALCSVAIAMAPPIAPLAGRAPAPVNDSAWEETRAQSIAPLAWGGDSGRRMAAGDAVVPLGNTPERPTLDLVATLGQGDGFARVLERAGVGEGQARRVAGLVSDVTPLSDIAPGTRISMVLGRRMNRNQARPLDSMEFRARFDLSLMLTRSGSDFTVTRIPIAIDKTPLRITGRVGDSLYRSARAAGAPGKAVEAYIRAVASKLSLGSDVTEDAQFDLVVEQSRAETGEVRIGKLLYAGLTRGSRKTQLLEWDVGGRTEWFEASGVGEKRGGMTSPVSGARQTSGYGMRFHPLLGYNRFHRGVDYGAAYGSPIRAVSDGLVAFSGRNAGYGNHVRLSHSGSLGTSYSHMSRITVSAGSRVSQGQVIGYVGSTGLSTGPHLHFEVYRNGQSINPRSVNFASTSMLSGNELAAFRARLAGMLAVPVRGSAKSE
jgi:murein DD-endopeptidase MepM/ murein hydrolase activator NlpD